MRAVARNAMQVQVRAEKQRAIAKIILREVRGYGAQNAERIVAGKTTGAPESNHFRQAMTAAHLILSALDQSEGHGHAA